MVDGVQAQVSSDRSLATEVTTEDNLNFTITEGDRVGNNLFHSFQEFSVPTNGSAIFENAETVENIINRVTGDFSSTIDGLIQTNGSANVFLINPNGIIFGENAVLKIGGSFLGTTAESLLFEDGFEFSTSNNGTKPLLTINVPLGVRFGNNPGTITNLSQTRAPNYDSTFDGLSVMPGKTLALLGGDINIDGGVVTASQGIIELGSVAGNNVVNFDSVTDIWNFDYSGVTQFQNIVLDNLALVTASGIGGGAIHLQGKEIRILNGSGITSDTIGAIDGQDITINASELLEIRGSDPTLQNIDTFAALSGILVPLPSRISANTFAQGNAGNINIATNNLLLSDGAKIESQTIDFQQTPGLIFGDGGNILIEARGSIILQGDKPLIGITDNVMIFPGFTEDQAIEINQVSIITAASLSNSLGGNIELFASELIIQDGNIISASPLNSGNGGQITISATELVEVIGASPRSGSTNSTIANSTFFNSGDSGDINVITRNLRLKEGGSVSTTTASEGNAGDIIINALEIELDGISSDGQFTSELATQTLSTGDAGDLVIQTEKLLVDNQAVISVQDSGSGVPGNIEILANSIELNNKGQITAETNSEQGGNININLADNLLLRNNSEISAEASGNANGGNVTISADFVIALPSENSDILANAIRGNGGNITITTEGIVGLEVTEGSLDSNLSEINASSEFGQNGSVIVVTPDEETVQPERDIQSNVSSLDRNSLDNYCRNLGKSSYKVTGRGGIPLLSEQKTSGAINWEDWRILEKVSESEVTTQDTNINAEIPASQDFVSYPKLAQGWFVNEQGQIILTAEPLVITPHPQQLTNTGC